MKTNNPQSGGNLPQEQKAMVTPTGIGDTSYFVVPAKLWNWSLRLLAASAGHSAEIGHCIADVMRAEADGEIQQVGKTLLFKHGPAVRS